MRKLIYHLMFCSSHAAIHFLRIFFFCYGWISVAIGIILGIERLSAQDSYDTESYYYYMIETHTKNILIVLVLKPPQPHTLMMLPYFLFVRSAFFLFLLGLRVMCKHGHLSIRAMPVPDPSHMLCMFIVD